MITFSVDGSAVAIHPGDSVASAIMRTGVLTFRRSRSGEPRGLYCGIGVCNDCLVTIDGRPNVRACVTPAIADMSVDTGTVAQ